MTIPRPVAGLVLAALIACPAPGFAAPVLDLLPNPDAGRSFGPADSGQSLPGGEPSRSNSYSAADPDSQPTLQTRHFGAAFQLTCAVADTPNDLLVVNHSPEALPPGTRIKWQLKGEGKRGFFALLDELGAGATLVADDVIDSAVDPAAACVARTI